MNQAICFLIINGFLMVSARHSHHMLNLQLPWFNDKRDQLKEDNPGIPECRTKACYKAAYNLMQSVNSSVDPCDDFYNYACGKWISNNPVPVTQSQWNKFDVLGEQMDRDIYTLLQENIQQSDMESVINVKRLYSACMDEDHLERRGVAPLVGLLDYLEGWPMAGWNLTTTEWYLLVAKTTKLLDVSPLLEASISFNKRDTSQRIITIDQPSLFLPRYELIDSVSKILGPYKEYVAKTAALLSRNYSHELPPAAVIMEADALVRFETRLAHITKSQEMRKNKRMMSHVTTVGRLQELTNSVPVMNSQIRIRWLPFLATLLKDAFPITELNENTQVVVKDMHYVYHLLMLLDSTPSRVIINYIQWRVVITMSRDLDKTMRGLSFEFNEKASLVKEDQPRWRDCVDNAGYMFFTVGYMYVKRHFSHYGKDKAIKMVAEIREAFRKEMSEIEWMDESTKEAALEKADYMNYFIGYPNWYANESALDNYYDGLKIGRDHFENVVKLRKLLVHKNLEKLGKPTNRDEWPFGPAIVNAFYNAELNSIIFPAGILQLPFFNDQQPDSLNYGGIGVIIGHEVSHGFDDEGRQADKLGNIHQWWSKDTETTYLDKTQCFIDQYQKYRVPELDSILQKIVTVNGLLTLGENIADNGGLRASYKAYRTQLARQGEQEATLPGFKHLSPDQLFFLSFANVWCESSSQRSLLSEVMDDSHSPHRYRVLGTLRNSPEFSAAWECPIGSSMNPVDKCQVW